MSAHWVSHGVTLFTAILFQANDATSYVVVSDELQHDKYAVYCFNKAILHQYTSVSGRHIDYLHIFSDGAASQFKNRYTLSTILDPTQYMRRLKKWIGVSLQEHTVKGQWMALANNET